MDTRLLHYGWKVKERKKGFGSTSTLSLLISLGVSRVRWDHCRFFSGYRDGWILRVWIDWVLVAPDEVRSTNGCYSYIVSSIRTRVHRFNMIADFTIFGSHV